MPRKERELLGLEYILDKPSKIHFPPEVLQRVCRTCGGPFTTGSRLQVYCAVCGKLRKRANKNAAGRRRRQRKRTRWLAFMNKL